MTLLLSAAGQDTTLSQPVHCGGEVQDKGLMKTLEDFQCLLSFSGPVRVNGGRSGKLSQLGFYGRSAKVGKPEGAEERSSEVFKVSPTVIDQWRSCDGGRGS